MSKIKVFINVFGGVVQSVHSDQPEGVEIFLHDADNQNEEIAELTASNFTDEDKIDAEIDRLEQEAEAAWDEIVKSTKECEILDWQI